MPWLSANPTISLHRLHLIRPHKLLGGPIRLCYQYDAIQIRAHSLIALMETIPAVKEKNSVFKEAAAGKNIKSQSLFRMTMGEISTRLLPLRTFESLLESLDFVFRVSQQPDFMLRSRVTMEQKFAQTVWEEMGPLSLSLPLCVIPQGPFMRQRELRRWQTFLQSRLSERSDRMD